MFDHSSIGTMEQVFFVYLALLSVGGLLMVVTAEPSVSAWIVTPEVDRKEGGQVHIRCIAANLESDHVVAWRTENPVRTLRWGIHSITANRRFMFETTQTGSRETTQDFTITDLQRDDTDEYVCSVHDPVHSGGNIIVASATVQLSVLYFPNESFPICSPYGPITVDTGTQLNMGCLSRSGNPTVMIEISHSPTSANAYTWAMSADYITVLRTLDVTVDAAIDGVTFICNISSSSFPSRSRSCNIGPVSIKGVTETFTRGRKTTTPTTLVTRIRAERTLVTTFKSTDSFSLQTTPHYTNDPPSSNPWIVAFIIAIILFVASLLVNIILSLAILKIRHFHKHLPERDTKAPKADPYMELQPTDDKNREYMEPTAKNTATDQSSYCQVAEVESPKHGNVTPGDSTNTKYEEVAVPKNSERQYQNIAAIN